MNQIEAILTVFDEWHENMGLQYLWYSCDDEFQRTYPNISIEYDPDTAFFKALEEMLNSGDQCLFYNLNSEDPSRDGEQLTTTPQKQLQMLKEVWIGKEAMDRMDKEEGYLGWYFLMYCPYSLAHKIYNEKGQFIKWWHAE